MKFLRKFVSELFPTISGVRKIMTTSDDDSSRLLRRLSETEGFENRRNDLLYHPPRSTTSTENEIVVYFGGDIQDYRERMETHRDNRRYADRRSLESTTILLSRKFPHANILTIKPSGMYLGSFACYSNFLASSEIGAPSKYPPDDHRAWEHLRIVLENAGRSSLVSRDFTKSPLILIGFSKGVVVLNQLVYELRNFNKDDDDSKLEILRRIRAWYWLDGAHAGSKRTWITDADVLDRLGDFSTKYRWRLRAHVTPRQVHDSQRPWIGQEETKFSRFLTRKLASTNLFERKLHFDGEEQSLENHFRILDVFEEDKTE